MESYNINSAKDFMKHLLFSDAFDDFYLWEAEITTYNTFKIDGKIHKEYYNSEEIQEIHEEYSRFLTLKPHILNIIKGKTTPLNFKIVLLSPEKYYLDEDMNTGIRYVLNIRFESGKIQLISAISRSDFTLDKTSDKHWDKIVGKLTTNLTNTD